MDRGRVGEGGWVRVGEGGWVCPPHATRSRVYPDHHTHTRSAPSPEARGPPLGGSMRPCAAACLRGHTAWLGGVAAWFDGGFPWVQSRRALAHLFASPAGDSAIRRPRRSGCARLCALRARTARIRLRDGRGCWWRVSTQSASPHRSPVCTDVDGEEAAGSHAWAATRSACSRRARSGAACWQRGGNERAHTARAMASRGRIGGGARCTPRGRGRLSRGRGRVTGTRGSHNDATLAS